jgi:hypothetical protein
MELELLRPDEDAQPGEEDLDHDAAEEEPGDADVGKPKCIHAAHLRATDVPEA